MNYKRKILIFELLILYVGIPIILLFYQTPVLKLVILLSGAIYAIIVIYLKRKYKLKEILFISRKSISWSKYLIRIFLVCSIILMLGFIFRGNYIFHIPYNTSLIPFLIIGYPLISVLPQELIYRFFYFERYGSLFGSRYPGILINATFFGFMHLIYGNPAAVIFSLIGGFFFAMTYCSTRSLLMTVTEHTIYGYFVFLSCYGHFFISENMFKILFNPG